MPILAMPARRMDDAMPRARLISQIRDLRSAFIFEGRYYETGSAASYLGVFPGSKLLKRRDCREKLLTAKDAKKTR